MDDFKCKNMPSFRCKIMSLLAPHKGFHGNTVYEISAMSVL